MLSHRSVKKNFSGFKKRKVFEDLVSLEILQLSKNKIKYLSAFQNFNKLTRVWLRGKVCIDEVFDVFEPPTSIAVLKQNIFNGFKLEETPITAGLNGETELENEFETSEINAKIATFESIIKNLLDLARNY
jgi:hypothetical protein